MSKDNEIFIRYFDYYKKHPNKFKTIDEGFLPKVIVTFGIIFVFFSMFFRPTIQQICIAYLA